jgi:hypothetical protein
VTFRRKHAGRDSVRVAPGAGVSQIEQGSHARTRRPIPAPARRPGYFDATGLSMIASNTWCVTAA